MYHFLLVVGSKNVSILHRFLDGAHISVQLQP